MQYRKQYGMPVLFVRDSKKFLLELYRRFKLEVSRPEGGLTMERLTTRSGFTNEVYLTGKADVCWADRPIEERAFCVGCHRHKGMDRTNCGALMLVDRLAAYEDTGLEPEEIIELKARMEGLEK